MKWQGWAGAVVAMCAGCARLPAGSVGGLSKPAPYHVVLIRGFLDWYSVGIDRLADELKLSQIDCTVFRDDQWHDVSRRLIDQPADEPIVLIGFSYGADDVISISRELGGAHRAVALLVTIDPVTPGRVPANVERCIDYYESNGVWDAFPWLRGIALSADEKGARVENIDIRHRFDLLVPDTRHATIAANEKVHAAIISAVMKFVASAR